MKYTHTLGPWKVYHESVADDNYNTSVDILANEANARLIAAAPDLLAALKEMVTWMPSGFAPQSKDRAMQMARDAIAKAEGTQSSVPTPSPFQGNQYSDRSGAFDPIKGRYRTKKEFEAYKRGEIISETPGLWRRIYNLFAKAEGTS